MEQKFKIGDKVEVTDGHKGVIVDEIYNQITGRLFSVDCGENGFGQYKASQLTLIEEMTERKFKVGDTVKAFYGAVGAVVLVSQKVGTVSPYCVEFEDKSIGLFSERCLTLIEPERKREYQKGDKVWHKHMKDLVVFVCYHDVISSVIIIVLPDGKTVSTYLEYIEPYTGQDKVDSIDKSTEPAIVPIKSNSDFMKELLESDRSKLKNKKTFTVILKSGVKIGVTEDRAKQLNADLLNGVSSTSILENKDQISGVYFKINSIAAIVPTESLMP